jgi:serine/threonine protein kinase
MATPASNAEFLDLVRKSQVAEEKRLEPYVEKLQAGTLPAEPGKLAGLMVHEGVLTHFQAEQILMGRWRRFTIGKYKVLEKLGSGGMGLVYLCEHKLMRRRVAVKVLPTAKAKDPAALERFQREARAVAALDHPNIVHAYDIDQDAELHFLVMEYVDGSSLQDLVKKAGPLDVTRASHYMRQAALGLGHAHEKGLVHRDIKPGNILVDRSGVVKILDMGLARFFLDEDDVLTKKYDENVLGTADYLAPEQIEDSHSVDTRADVYSLGATFYFILTGQPPFGEGTVHQKLAWHLSRQPKPVAEVRAGVPAGLSNLIQRMMAKKPDDRFAHLEEVAEALTPWTATTIAPPADAEMPARALAGVAAESTVVSKMPASSVPRLTRPLPTPKSPLPIARSPQSAPSVVVADSLPDEEDRPPAPAVVTDSESAEHEAPWGNLEADTDDPSAKADTGPQDARPRSGVRPRGSGRNGRRLVITVAFLVFLSGVSFAVWQVLSKQRSGGDTPTGRPPRIVSKDSPSARSYRSIREALSNARPGDVIELADERHVENLTIDPSRTTAVTIQAKPGLDVVWSPATKDLPLLHLTSARGFKLKGKGLTLDGTVRGQTVENLITIQLHCPGLVLEDAHLQGFSRRGIQIMNCWGEKGNPVRLSGLAIHGERAQAAIYLDATPQIQQPPYNDFIDIDSSCRFPGFAEDRAILRRDNTVHGSHITRPGTWTK